MVKVFCEIPNCCTDTLLSLVLINALFFYQKHRGSIPHPTHLFRFLSAFNTGLDHTPSKCQQMSFLGMYCTRRKPVCQVHGYTTKTTICYFILKSIIYLLVLFTKFHPLPDTDMLLLILMNSLSHDNKSGVLHSN